MRAMMTPENGRHLVLRLGSLDKAHHIARVALHALAVAGVVERRVLLICWWGRGGGRGSG